VRYRDARDYQDHLRMLWSDAVRCRLRIDGIAWAELSGGLDSSSVVCMADLLIKRSSVDARSLRVASHATLESPEGDERRFIHEVEAQTGLRSEILGVERHQDLIDPDWNWVTPFAARGVGLARVQFVRAQDGRVVLSGRVGDAVMGCETDNSAAVFDDLADKKILLALANLRRWSRACRKPFLEIAWRLFHPQRDPAMARMAERARTGIAPGGVSLLTRELRTEATPADDSVMRALTRVRRSKRELAVMLLGYSLESRLNLPQQPPGVVFSYPFTPRPLVQFVLSIPGEQLSAPGEPRALMRRAFVPFVPSRILARRSKGYYPPSSTRAARKAVAALGPVEALEVVRRGWIEPSALEAARRSLLDGGGHSGSDLRRVLRLEEWLQSRHRRAPAVIPQRKEVNTDEVLNA
jgi:asparagine synthase (glutamine-hydrolysing)